MTQLTLQLLIFSIGESYYGVDVDQIACLKNYDCAAPVIGFHELVSVNSEIGSSDSKMIMVKNKENCPAVVISEPEDIFFISFKAIRPLPPILAHLANGNGVWGVVPQKRGMIVLFDFYKNERFGRLGRQEAYNETYAEK